VTDTGAGAGVVASLGRIGREEMSSWNIILPRLIKGLAPNRNVQHTFVDLAYELVAELGAFGRNLEGVGWFPFFVANMLELRCAKFLDLRICSGCEMILHELFA